MTRRSTEAAQVVEVVHHGHTWLVHVVPDRVLRIGRGAECDVKLANDALVSRDHLELRWTDDGLEVTDLGSQNGTQLVPHSATMDDATVPLTSAPLVPGRARKLALGDQLRVGSATLRVRSAAEPPAAPVAGRVVIVDPRMAALHELLGRLAATDLSVLLLGESGVGKEVFARSLHERSARRDRVFMSLNCGAFAETLLESELFGHERGAFTGASHARPGLLEAADGGTVFFDEVGELPAALQVKLLRVLEDRKVMRLGAREARQIDVRFVAATNRDLVAAVAGGRFRQDLYFRLNGMTISIPPLRERPAELVPLALDLLAQASQRSGRPPPRFTAAALARLQAHTWPGNVRELRNVMARAAALAQGDQIGADELMMDPPPAGDEAMPLSPPAPPTSIAPAAASPLPDDDERGRIVAALEACAGNQTRAAAMLGVTRRVLSRRLDRYGLPRPRG